MALEDITAGSTIADLITSNPVAGDNVSQGDDHLRNIKKSLQFTFPNISATVSGVAAELDFAHKGGTVSGNALIKGTLSVSGASHITGDLSTGGDAHIGGDLSVGGGTVFIVGTAPEVQFRESLASSASGKWRWVVDADRMFLRHNSAAGGDFSTENFQFDVADGLVNVKVALSVSGNTNLLGTLSVGGRANFNSGMSVSGSADFADNVHVVGTLTVNGISKFTNDISVDGLINIASNLSVSGNAHVSGGLTVNGVTVLTNNLSVGGNTTLGGNLTVSGSSQLVGNVALNSNLSVAGNTQMIGTLTVNGAGIFSNDLVVNGNAGLNANLSLSGNGHVVGSFTVNGIARFTNNVSIEGNATLASNLSVAGGTHLAGTLSLSGTCIIQATAPQIQFRETDAGVSANGKWRVVADADLFFIRRNTAAGGDFTSETNYFIMSGGSTTINAHVVSANVAQSASKVNGIRMYAARIGAFATAIWNPHGWSFSLGATDVQVTHNIGVSSYAAVATVDGLQTYVAINGVTNNGFRIRVNDVDGTATQAVVYLQIAATQ